MLGKPTSVINVQQLKEQCFRSPTTINSSCYLFF